MGKDKKITIDKLAKMIKNGFDEAQADRGLIKADVEVLKEDVGTLKTDVAILKTKVTNIESQMVTKEYLTDELADLEGDLIVKLRKEDKKMDTIKNILHKKEILSEDDMAEIGEIKVFPVIGGSN